MPSAKGLALTESLEAPWNIQPPLTPQSITQQHLLGLALHFFNLQAHYQKSLGRAANQRQELGFARNSRNQKWMIPGREISSARSPREYSNLQSKALFNIYLAMHLLRFSPYRCRMEGAALLSGSHLTWWRTPVPLSTDAVAIQKWMVAQRTSSKLCTCARIRVGFEVTQSE